MPAILAWALQTRLGKAVSLALAVLLAVWGVRYSARREGYHEAVQEGMEDAHEAIKDARTARHSAGVRARGDGLYEDDGYRRD